MLKKQREQTENNQNNPGNKNSDANTSIPNSNVNIHDNNNNKNSNKAERNSKTVSNPVRHVEKQTTPQRKATMEPKQSIDRLCGTEDRRQEGQTQVQEKANQEDSNETTQAAAQKLN